MSTVLLTPTHIACDHTVVHKTFPHKTKVDLEHKKIFLSPDQTLVIGTTGEFFPHLIDTPEVFNDIRTLFIESVAQSSNKALGFDTSVVVTKSGIAAYDRCKTAFGLDMSVIVVSRKNRYLFRKSKVSDLLGVKRCEDYCGLGSGGMTGAGMMLGGVSLKDVWAKINDLDCQTSIEHTAIPLSRLKKFSPRIITKIIKDMRS